MPSPPRVRPVVNHAALQHPNAYRAPEPPAVRNVNTVYYQSPPPPPASIYNTPVQVSRSTLSSPTAPLLRPPSTPLRAASFQQQPQSFVPYYEAPQPTAVVLNTPKAMQHVAAPPPELRSRIRLSPQFPFRDTEYVESQFELSNLSVPFQWYLQIRETDRQKRESFETAIRNSLIALLARRAPLLLRDIYIEIVPGVAQGIRLDFSTGKPLLSSARWPIRVYLAIRSTSQAPCSLIVHALEDVIAGQPVVHDLVTLLEGWHGRSVGSGELFLVDLDAYATHIDDPQQEDGY